MSNEEITSFILKRRGFTQYHGNKDNLSAIMYFFLMDASYQAFLKYKWEANGVEKTYLKRWAEGYDLFFADFRAAYTADQYNDILDKVDDFEAFLAHHLNIAEIAVQEADNKEPLDTQMRNSCCWLSHLLANDAKDFHGEVWKTGRHQPLQNRYIDQVVKNSKEYAKRWNKTIFLTERKINRIQDSVHVIANKICEWVMNDYKKEIEKKNG